MPAASGAGPKGGDSGSGKTRLRRGYHTRSRLGCLACKACHRRCDELRPTCTRCAAEDRRCDYSQPAIPVREKNAFNSTTRTPGLQEPWALATTGSSIERHPLPPQVILTCLNGATGHSLSSGNSDLPNTLSMPTEFMHHHQPTPGRLGPLFAGTYSHACCDTYRLCYDLIGCGQQGPNTQFVIIHVTLPSSVNNITRSKEPLAVYLANNKIRLDEPPPSALLTGPEREDQSWSFESDMISELPETFGWKAQAHWQRVSRLYFGTVHTWFQVLNEASFRRAMRREAGHVGTPQSAAQHSDQGFNPNDRGYELLVLCMHLVTAPAIPNEAEGGGEAVNVFYWNAKRFFASLSLLSDPGLEWLQSGLLLALFEFGQRSPDVAYRTLSETAAFAHVSGYNPGRYLPDAPLKPTGDREEDYRALWWGVFILDQYIHLEPTMRTMPDLIEGPDDDTLLPTNGLVRGDGGPPHHFVVHFPVGASVAVSLGGFQRTAQSATILHQARQWERRSQRTDPPPQVSDFAKLDGQARTLLNAMLLQSSNWEVFCDALALCISSLFVLYGGHLPSLSSLGRAAKSTQSSDENKAAAAIEFAVKFISDLAEHFNSQAHQVSQRLAMLAPPATLAGILAAMHIDILADAHENRDKSYAEIVRTLQTFSRRWKFAESLLQGLVLDPAVTNVK